MCIRDRVSSVHLLDPGHEWREEPTLAMRLCVLPARDSRAAKREVVRVAIEERVDDRPGGALGAGMELSLIHI